MSTLVYTPPQLPEYLRNVCDLKPMVGVPSDDQVIGIHSVIRSASIISQVPGMYDPVLSLNLAQHLFEVQMARYRSKYSFSPFPGDNIYTPPSLPPHVTIRLEPVIGNPSDEEMTKVHTAIRSYDRFSDIPSMFDPHTHMQLALHMFDLQIARYIQRTAQGQSSTSPAQTVTPAQPARHPETPTSSLPRQQVNATESAHAVTSQMMNVTDPRINASPARPNIASGATRVSLPRNIPDSNDTTFQVVTPEKNQLLARIGDALENMNQILVGTQNSKARILLIKDQFLRYNPFDIFSLINDKGESPLTSQMPSLSMDKKKWSDCDVARYLRFYKLGEDLLEDAEIPTLKPGKGDAANSLLWNHLSAASSY